MQGPCPLINAYSSWGNEEMYQMTLHVEPSSKFLMPWITVLITFKGHPVAEPMALLTPA